ncbi:MAG: hypothetical protein V8S34_03410 [Lawsonibacter sp.]
MGVNVGFMPAGATIGATIAAGDKWLLVPIGHGWLLHRPGGAGGAGAGPAGGGDLQRLHYPKVHQPALSIGIACLWALPWYGSYWASTSCGF